MTTGAIVTVPRLRYKLTADTQHWSTPIKGPIVVVDQCVYNSQSPAVSSRNTSCRFYTPDGSGLFDNANLNAMTSGQWCLKLATGPDSDTLANSSSSFPNGKPVDLLGDLRGPNWPSSLKSDLTRDCLWVTAIPSGMPLWGRNPLLSDHEVLVSSNPLNVEDTFGVTYSVMSDWKTKNFPSLRDRGVSVHSPCAAVKLRSRWPYTVWLPVTVWNYRSVSGVTTYTTIAYSGFARIDIYGLELVPLILEHCSLFDLIYQGSYGTVDGVAAPTFAESIWSAHESELNLYHINAAAKANRGAMDTIVTILELPKTKRLLSGSRAKMKKLRSWFASNNTVTRKTVTDTIPRSLARSWLEARYGWRQILFDVQGLTRLLQRLVRAMRKTYSSGNYPGSFKESLETDSRYFGSFSQGSYKFSGEHVTLRSGVSLGPSMSLPPWLQEVNEAIGGVNVLAVIWEYTKFSWVFDRFFDVGLLLRAYGRNPARFSRAWHTLHMPLEYGSFQFQGSIGPTELRDAVKLGNPALTNSFTRFIDLLWNDEEDPPFSTGAGIIIGEASYYFREVVSPSYIPFENPTGGLDRVGQAVDIMALGANRIR